jgi:hypothetical protein
MGEHEAVIDEMQARLDRDPDKMRVRRQTAEHPYGTIKAPPDQVAQSSPTNPP